MTELEPQDTTTTPDLSADSTESAAPALDTSAPDGTPDASAPVSTPDPAAPRETYTDKNGRLREKGSNKFLRADGGEAPAPEGETVTPDPVGEAPPAEAAAEPDIVPQPWSFVAEGQTYTLGNAAVYPGVGLVVPEAHIDTLHRMLGRTIKADHVLAQRDQMLAQAREEAAHMAEFNQTAAKQWEALAEMVRQGRQDEAYTLLVEFANELPVLRAEAKAQVLERRLTQREEASRPSPQAVFAEARQDAWQTLDGMFREALGQPWAQGVTPEDHKAVADLLSTLEDRLVIQAPQDYPEAGIARGDWVLDVDKAGALIRRELERASTYRRQIADATKAREAAQKQAEAQKARTKETIAAPPTVGGSSGTATPKPSKFVPKTPEEYQAWLEQTTRG